MEAWTQWTDPKSVPQSLRAAQLDAGDSIRPRAWDAWNDKRDCLDEPARLCCWQ
jgi:hypothetical protein